MARAGKDTTRFNTEDDGIGHVLRDHPLEVPIYQRSYAWTEEQVQQFWDDLKSALSLPQPEYFMGTLVLAPGTEGRLTVIDGQQRLATTAILLAAFRNYFQKVGDKIRAETIESDYLVSRSLRSGELEPRLQLNLDDSSFFNEVVIGRNSFSQAPPPSPSHASTVRLQEALALLETRVELEAKSAGRNWAEIIFKWVEFLATGVRVIVVTVNNGSDAFLIFETLNDRGIVLSISDLLKNYLFGVAKADIELAQDSWKQVVGSFESPGEEETLTSFLRHFWSSTHGATRERDLYRRIRAEIKSLQQASSMIEDLKRAAPAYAALLDSEHERWLDFPSVRKAEVETLLRFGLEQNRPLLLAAMNAFSDPELSRLIRAIISWSVRGLVAGGIGGGVTERYYSDCAVSISRGEIDTVEGVFDYLSPIIVTDEVFESSFATRRVNNIRLAKYYLLAIERHDSFGIDAAFPSNSAEAAVGLDRILPRRSNPYEWPAFEPNEQGQWALRLGNAVLLDASEDSLTSEDSWSVKHAVMSTSKFWTTSSATDNELWTPESVDRRQANLASVAINVWPRLPQ